VTMQIEKAFLLVALSAINMCCVGAERVQPDAQPPATTQILVLNMRVSSGQHEVTSARVVDSPVPLKTRIARSAPMTYAVTDAEDNALSVGSMDDPRVVRGPMSPPGEAVSGHPIVLQDSVEYVLRVPYSKNVRYLKFLSSAPTNDATREKIANEKTQQVIDLLPFVAQ
jgi:hypothetical protein